MLLVAFIVIVALLIKVAITQAKIIKEDKLFKKEITRRVSKANKELDIELYKRIQQNIKSSDEDK